MQAVGVQIRRIEVMGNVMVGGHRIGIGRQFVGQEDPYRFSGFETKCGPRDLTIVTAQPNLLVADDVIAKCHPQRRVD